MKRKVSALSIILLGVFLLTASTPSQAATWELERELNPSGKTMWMVIAEKEMRDDFGKFMEVIKKEKKGWTRFGFKSLDSPLCKSAIAYNLPLIISFSTDQIALKKINPKYRYLLILSVNELEKILAEGKCVIVSRKVRVDIVKEILDDKGKWVVVFETDEENYITLIAAPNKKALKKAIDRFFTLEEIPLEPIIFTPK